jgi:hypothetical protein
MWEPGRAFLFSAVGKDVIHVTATSPTPRHRHCPGRRCWGGPGYFWLPTEDISGLPIANFALRLGSQPGGHVVS